MLALEPQNMPERATYHGSSDTKHGASRARSNVKYVYYIVATRKDKWTRDHVYTLSLTV